MHACTLVIMGATGDLTRRKLIPAIHKLLVDKKIEKIAVVGVSNIKTTAEHVLWSSEKYIEQGWTTYNAIASIFYYEVLNFYCDTDYQKLAARLSEVEAKHGLPGNRLFYLATMPEHFAPITKKLLHHGIAQKAKKTKKAVEHEPWSRVVYEKPFGSDLASARSINKAIAEVFSERQAYRIDHYLGKEVIGNIALVRFTNLFFQPLWNKKYIESVQIIMREKIGIEGRGQFYDSYGAVKDVVQNHVLQMLALVAMESPRLLSGEYIRNAKVNVLKKVTVEDILLGQYAGYIDEKGVAKNSRTETFAALKVSIHNRRWSRVPFYLLAGKNLSCKHTAIHIKFKHPICLLAKNCPTDSNYLTFRVQPDAGFFLELNAKVPNQAYQVTPVTMDFSHRYMFGPNTAGAYEVLLQDAIRGDQSTFVRFDEIEYSWKIVENALQKRRKLHVYEPGSDGPEYLETFEKKHAMRWRL